MITSISSLKDECEIIRNCSKRMYHFTLIAIVEHGTAGANGNNDVQKEQILGMHVLDRRYYGCEVSISVVLNNHDGRFSVDKKDRPLH